MHASESSYSSSSAGTQRRKVSQPGSGHNVTGHSVTGVRPSFNSTNLCNQTVCSPGLTLPQLQSQHQMQPQEWYQPCQSQLGPTNHCGYIPGNAAAASILPIDPYPGSRTGQFQYGFNGPQHILPAQTAARFDPLYLGSFVPERNHEHVASNEQVQEFAQQPAGISSSLPNIGGHLERSLDSEMSTPGSRGRLQQTPSNSHFTMIGAVYYSNDDTKEFRCHVDGCAERKCGRLQELKRHWSTFHEESIIWCPIRGCERSEGVGTKSFSKARKDKLKDHARKVHGIELEL